MERSSEKDGYGNVGMYLEEKNQRAQSPSLARHSLPSSEAKELGNNIKVGSFYEVDHSKLSTKSPEQLFSIGVVMVSEKNSQSASLRFPSVHSLRTHFSEESNGEQDEKKLPSLDEKYVMDSDIAAKVLFRRIPPQEMAARGNFWSFWSPPSLSSGKDGMKKKGSCLSHLRNGMVQWGKRRQVRFLNRHEGFKDNPLAVSGLSVENENKEDEEEEERKDSEKEDVDEEDGKEEEEEEEEEEEKAETVKILRSYKRKLHDRNTSKAESSKRARRQKGKQKVDTRSKKKSIMKNSIERWSIARYKLAEENMLKIMKAKGAFFGNPILRPALRNEARKLIGDTGLLDHLLKHMSGKVAPGGADRFRRRHNCDGAMEYWIESADLVNVRKQAGVQDPYWTPPPGWKPGDNPIQDPISAREIESIKREMSKLKKTIHELVSNNEDETAIVTRELKGLNERMGKMTRDMEKLALKKTEDLRRLIQPNFAMNFECDSESYFPLMKKLHSELVSRKSKIEEQLVKMYESLSELEEQMKMIKSGGILLPEVEAPPLTSLMASQSDKETSWDYQKKNKGQNSKATTLKYGSVQIEDQDHSGDKAREDRETRIQRLKSGFRICKPQGSFLWPNMVTFTQSAIQNHEPFVVPTPPSASSTSATPFGSHQISPVKPRPVRPKASSSSFAASITIPPKTPNSLNINIFNLNEAPLEHNIHDAGASSSFQAEKEQGDE